MEPLAIAASVISIPALLWMGWSICSDGYKTIRSVPKSIRPIFRDLKKMGWKSIPSMDVYTLVHPKNKYMAVPSQPISDPLRIGDVVRIYDRNMGYVTEIVAGSDVSTIDFLH